MIRASFLVKNRDCLFGQFSLHRLHCHASYCPPNLSVICAFRSTRTQTALARIYLFHDRANPDRPLLTTQRTVVISERIDPPFPSRLKLALAHPAQRFLRGAFECFLGEIAAGRLVNTRASHGATHIARAIRSSSITIGTTHRPASFPPSFSPLSPRWASVTAPRRPVLSSA